MGGASDVNSSPAYRTHLHQLLTPTSAKLVPEPSVPGERGHMGKCESYTSGHNQSQPWIIPPPKELTKRKKKCYLLWGARCTDFPSHLELFWPLSSSLQEQGLNPETSTPPPEMHSSWVCSGSQCQGRGGGKVLGTLPMPGTHSPSYRAMLWAGSRTTGKFWG